jgi:hypothetical protein
LTGRGSILIFPDDCGGDPASMRKRGFKPGRIGNPPNNPACDQALTVGERSGERG